MMVEYFFLLLMFNDITGNYEKTEKSENGSHKNHAQCKCHVTMRRILKKIKVIKRSNEKEISHYWNTPKIEQKNTQKNRYP